VAALRALGDRVTYRVYAGVEHSPIVAAAAAAETSFIAARLR
jgi:hypothetical protein